MELFSDVPIQGKAEDKLGRMDFANSLAKHICSVPSDNGFTVGLYGKWGTGKTSLINMMVEAINTVHESSEESKPIIVRFEPWNYVDASQLLSQFFRELSSNLNVKNGDKVLLSAGKALEDYANAAEFLELIPSIGLAFKIVNAVSARAGARMLEKGKEGSQDLSLKKKKVCEKLRETKSRIIVIIDDIDRLTNDQIRMVFQLVNSIARFPNVIYLLSFDREIVCRALEKVQDCDGEEYLEKIVQLPISLPEVNEQKVFSALFSGLDELLSLQQTKLFNQTRWQHAFVTCLESRVRSIRDAKRFLNAFAFQYQNLGQEIDFADLAVMTSLQIWDSALFNWILLNSNQLCGAAISYLGARSGDSKKEIEEMERSLVAAVGDKQVDYAKDVLKFLFPKGQRLFGGVITGDREDEMHLHGRLACRDCFERAFCFSLSEIKIPKGEVKEKLEHGNSEELFEVLSDYAQRGVLDEFAKILRPLQQEIAVHRYPIIAESIMRILGKCKEPEGGTFELPTDRRLEMILESLLQSMGNDKAEDVIDAAFKKMDSDNLMAFATFLNSMELDHGRYGNEGQKKDESSVIISSGYLTKLEQLFISRIKEEGDRENLLERTDSHLALCVWEKLEKSTHDNYIARSLVSSDKAVAMYATRTAGQWNSMGYPYNNGWTFNSFSEEFVSRQRVLEAIERFRKEEDFWKLSTQDQEKLATFVLNEYQDDKDRSVTIQEANRALEYWKIEYTQRGSVE